VGAEALLRQNLASLRSGGLIVPFIGIKFIDLLLVAAHWTLTEPHHGQTLRQAILTLLGSTVLTASCIRGRSRDRRPVLLAGRQRLADSTGGDRLVGLRADRPAIRRPAVLLAAALCHIAAAIRRPQLGWFESRSD